MNKKDEIVEPEPAPVVNLPSVSLKMSSLPKIDLNIKTPTFNKASSPPKLMTTAPAPAVEASSSSSKDFKFSPPVILSDQIKAPATLNTSSFSFSIPQDINKSCCNTLATKSPVGIMFSAPSLNQTFKPKLKSKVDKRSDSSGSVGGSFDDVLSKMSSSTSASTLKVPSPNENLNCVPEDVSTDCAVCTKGRNYEKDYICENCRTKSNTLTKVNAESIKNLTNIFKSNNETSKSEGNDNLNIGNKKENETSSLSKNFSNEPLTNNNNNNNNLVSIEGFGTTFKKKSDQWDCDICMVRNSNSTDTCISCMTKKPGANVVEEKNVNNCTDKKVENNFGAQFMKSSKQWDCDVCCVRNKDEANKCVACETPRPGALVTDGVEKRDDKKTESQFKFGFGTLNQTASTQSNVLSNKTGFQFGVGSSSDTTSTFKFGVSSSATTSTSTFKFGVVVESKENSTETPKIVNAFEPTSDVKSNFSFSTKTELPKENNGFSTVFGNSIDKTPTIPTINFSGANSEESSQSTTLKGKRKHDNSENGATEQKNSFSSSFKIPLSSSNNEAPFFTFGSATSNSNANSSTGSAPAFTFGAPTPADKNANTTTMFTFGASSSSNAQSSNGTAPVFSFGKTTPNDTSKKQEKTVFTFGSATSNESTKKQENPVFSFGESNKNEAVPKPTENHTNNLFTFGKSELKQNSTTGMGFGAKNNGLSTGTGFGSSTNAFQFGSSSAAPVPSNPSFNFTSSTFNNNNNNENMAPFAFGQPQDKKSNVGFDFGQATGFQAPSFTPSEAPPVFQFGQVNTHIISSRIVWQKIFFQTILNKDCIPFTS